MAFEFPIRQDFYFVFAAAIAMLLLSAWIVFLDPRSKVHRALALLLFLRAMFLGLLPFSSPFTDIEGRLRVYFAIALPFAAVYLVHAVRLRYGAAMPSPRFLASRRLPWVLLAIVAVLELVYLSDHALYGELRNGTGVAGPLDPIVDLQFAFYAGLALLLFSSYRTSPPGPVRDSWRMLSLGLLLDPLYLSTFLVSDRILDFILKPGEALGYYTEQPIWVFGTLFMVLAFAFCVAWAIRAWRLGRADASARAETRRALTILAFPFVCGLIAGAMFVPNLYQFHFVFYGIWTLSFPLILAYAIVRYQLFGIDVKVNWTIRQSTMASIFVAVFFIVSETAQTFFAQRIPGQETTSNILGILAAGALLFALAPVERIASRVANSAVPARKHFGRLDPQERMEVYREHAMIAWADGELSRKERMMLDRMREKLGIAPDEARRVERFVAAAEMVQSSHSARLGG